MVLVLEWLDYYFEWFNVCNCVDIIFIIYDVNGLLECDIIWVRVVDGVYVVFMCNGG